MALSNDLLTQFAKSTKDETQTKKESTAYGQIKTIDGVDYVQLDGSELLTPITSTTVVNDGDRVMVTIKNHTAIVTGDLTTPSASNNDVTEIGNKISQFEIVIADKVTTEQLEAEIAKIDKLIADNLEATNAKFETIEGKVAEIDTIKADIVEVEGKITAHEGEFTTIRGDIADFKELTAENFEAVNGRFHTIESDYADFKEVTTNKITANEASITELETKKLDAETASITFANIDFSNIGEAAIEKLFADSGIIKDLVVSDGKITGELVGVTIKGDLIEANTLKADKLVVLGEDGLYYKLNVNALGEATASSDPKYQNGLDGSVIVAESITAEKVAVDDLVAFDATIGGFNIGTNSIYSGTKNAINNTTRGIYLDKDGQVNFGDANNYLKYYKDSNNNYILEIAAKSITLGSSNKNLEETINELEENTEKKWVGTRAEYDAIDPKDPDTYYYITDDVDEYITESRFELNNESINASVTSITNQQAADSAKIDSLNNDFTTLSKSVEAKMTSDEVTLAIKSEIANGVDKVVTKEKKFTFDDEGLTISEGNMENNVDEDGILVNRVTTGETVTKEEVLKADSDGVRALNLESKTYLSVAKRSKFEKFVKNGKDRIGCFWTNE